MELKRNYMLYNSIGEKDFYMIKNGVKYSYRNIHELAADIEQMAKKAYSIQRYKGLGEMNPDQLWDTTMNPDKRSLYRFTIEDAMEADKLFSLLMGDFVPPRREFIQENAHKVYDLDF